MKDENELTKNVIEPKKFELFCSEVEGDFDELELQFLYLKAGRNLPLSKVAKILERRYVDIVKLSKKLEETVNNIRLDYKLAILHSEKVHPDKIFRAKAKEVKSILSELQKRAQDEDRFKGVSDKHLHEILSKISDDLTITGDYYTGETENGLFPREKAKGNFD